MNYPQRFILLLIIFSLANSNMTLAASVNVGAKVLAAIESYDRTLASGEVYGRTFGDAILSLAAENSIEIISSFNEKTRLIQSVGGVANRTFDKTDEWFGYIDRGGKIIRSDDIMNSVILPGDYVVLCYGEQEKIKIITGFEITVSGDTAKIYLKSEPAGLNGAKGGLADARVNFIAPNGSIRIAKTDRNGIAHVKLSGLGMYKYFAESYEIGALPKSVRSKDYYMVFGAKDPERLTRAEATAFIVNSFNIPQSFRANPFKDVGRDNPFYGEINAAHAAGLVSGYGDNTFDPDSKINLLQFSVMMSGLYKNNSNLSSSVAGVPSWAAQKVRRVVAGGDLDKVEHNWDADVTSEMLTQIYLNHMKLPS